MIEPSFFSQSFRRPQKRRLILPRVAAGPRPVRAAFPLCGGGVALGRLFAIGGMAVLVLASAIVKPIFAAAAEPAPQRLVSLVPGITETLFALGLGSRVVGVSTYCDFPKEAASLPKVGTFTEPVAEVIVALRPDLVLTSPSPGNESAVRAIERTGVKVAVVQSEGGLAEARASMLEISKAVGAAELGEVLVSSIDTRLAQLKAAAEQLDHPSAVIVIGREPLVLAGPASYLGELLVLVGAVNVAEGVGGRWPRTGLEFLVASRPQVLVDLSFSMEGASVESDPGSRWTALASIPALTDGRVVTEQASVMLRPGPRLAEAAEALFKALHPAATLPPKAGG